MTYKKVVKLVNGLLEGKDKRKLEYELKRLLDKYGEIPFTKNLLKYVDYKSKTITKYFMDDFTTLNFKNYKEYKLENKQYYTYETNLIYEIKNLEFIIVNLISQKIDNYKKLILKHLHDNYKIENMHSDKVLIGSNLSMVQYNKLSNILYRYGNKPYLFGDDIILDHFMFQNVCDSIVNKKYSELLNQNETCLLGRSKLLNLHNKHGYNSELDFEYDINKGFLVANPIDSITILENKKSELNYKIEGNITKLEIINNFDIEFDLKNKVIVIQDDSLRV